MIYEGIDTRTAPKNAYLQLRLEVTRKFRWKEYAREHGLSLSNLIIIAVEKLIG